MSTKKRIYVVFGETGEYEDRRKWQVIAYTSEAEARYHAREAQKVANEYEPRRSSSFSAEPGANPHDPYMDMDSNGTRYYVDDLELVEEP